MADPIWCQKIQKVAKFKKKSVLKIPDSKSELKSEINNKIKKNKKIKIKKIKIKNKKPVWQTNIQISKFVWI